MTKIYVVKREGSVSYDEYAGFVCIADSEEAARDMHPSGSVDDWDADYDAWIKRAYTHTLSVTCIGLSLLEPQIVLTDYHAG
jgi:hypothetical protein